MITREDINTAYKKGTQRTTGLLGAALLIESFDDLRRMAEKLLEERDTALQEIERLEQVNFTLRRLVDEGNKHCEGCEPGNCGVY